MQRCGAVETFARAQEPRPDPIKEKIGRMWNTEESDLFPDHQILLPQGNVRHTWAGNLLNSLLVAQSLGEIGGS